MATRRPSVPKAKFGAGLAPEPVVKSSTPDPGSGAHLTEASQPAASGASKPRERRATTAPTTRRHEDGVVHTSTPGPVPARRFSGRLIVLLVSLVVITIFLVPSVRLYLEQRAEITALQEDIAAKELAQKEFETQLQRWDDPAFVKQQARDRVSMLMPGETGYWVYGADESTELVGGAAESNGSTTAKDATTVTDTPWIDALWTAVQSSAKVQAAPAP